MIEVSICIDGDAGEHIDYLVGVVDKVDWTCMHDWIEDALNTQDKGLTLFSRDSVVHIPRCLMEGKVVAIRKREIPEE